MRLRGRKRGGRGWKPASRSRSAAVSASSGGASSPSAANTRGTSAGRTPAAAQVATSASTSVGRPETTTRPSCSRTNRSASAAVVVSWSITRSVNPSARSAASVRITSARPTGSRSVVGSSRSMMPGRSASSPAIASRCFSPPESVVGSRPSNPASPTPASARRSRAGISPAGTPVCSRPKTTSCVTSLEKSCASKSWNTMPIVPASSPTRRPSIGSPASRMSPRTSAGVKHGTMRVRQRASVDLPAPVAPMTTASAPTGSSRSTPSSAARPPPS
jgi:hypothetical protein